MEEEKFFLIDPHCHLQYFTSQELSEYIPLCLSHNMKYFLSNSTSSKDFDKTLELSNEYKEIIPGIGYHPWYLDDIINNESWFEEFKKYNEKLIQKNIKYFIGEIGIDGGRPKKKFPLEKQIDIFMHQLLYANDTNKLVTIHCVYEWEKLFKVMEKASISNLIEDKIILHSFQGTKKIMEKFKTLNVWYSISPGCYNQKNSEMLRDVPIDRLLIESDAPSMFNKDIYENKEEYQFYFKEISHEGLENFKNHSLCIVNLAKKIAELKNINLDEFMRILAKNYKKIFDVLI